MQWVRYVILNASTAFLHPLGIRYRHRYSVHLGKSIPTVAKQHLDLLREEYIRIQTRRLTLAHADPARAGENPATVDSIIRETMLQRMRVAA